MVLNFGNIMIVILECRGEITYNNVVVLLLFSQYVWVWKGEAGKGKQGDGREGTQGKEGRRNTFATLHIYYKSRVQEVRCISICFNYTFYEAAFCNGSEIVIYEAP